MRLIVTASALESVGGSVAAVALADGLRERFGALAFASADTVGAFSRMHAERDARGDAIARDQSPRGVRWIDSAEQILRDQTDEVQTLLCDYTGEGRMELMRWPEDTLRAMIAPGVQTVFLIVSSASSGAETWLARVLAVPELATRTLVGVVPFAARSAAPVLPTPGRIAIPILERDAWAFIDRKRLPPKTAQAWSGDGINSLTRSRILEWREAWGRVIDALLATGQPALPTGEPTTPTHTSHSSMETT